eukprot:JZ554706.1.p5 GENE.JZ554706.1~~JZ554706.1.p5  ORF type:complete len:58 (+),score=9.13 JZ554706.1:385-558(+)
MREPTGDTSKSCARARDDDDDNVSISCTEYGVYQTADGHWWCQLPSNAYGNDVVCLS